MRTLKTSPWLFFLLTFGLTWVLHVPAALSGQDRMEFPTVLLYMLGGFGPSVAGIILIYREKDRRLRKDFWQRAIDFRRIRGSGYFVALLLSPILFALVLGLDVLLGGQPPALPTLAAAAAQPATLIGVIIPLIIFGPISEELGWRGYALDRLQARFSPLASSLVLGLLWWAWHLPLFFIRGTSQSSFGVFTLPSWSFLVMLIGLSALMSWNHNQNKRSTLAAILLHFSFALAFTLAYPFSDRAFAFSAVLMCLSAALLWRFRPIRPGELDVYPVATRDEGELVLSKN
jgi:membrane protease YdiL (CAAX protease family)